MRFVGRVDTLVWSDRRHYRSVPIEDDGVFGRKRAGREERRLDIIPKRAESQIVHITRNWRSEGEKPIGLAGARESARVERSRTKRRLLTKLIIRRRGLRPRRRQAIAAAWSPSKNGLHFSRCPSIRRRRRRGSLLFFSPRSKSAAMELLTLGKRMAAIARPKIYPARSVGSILT